MTTLMGSSGDAQGVVDAYTALADGLGAVAESASSSEMQAAATAAQADMIEVRDGIREVYVRGNISEAGELAGAVAAMQQSYQTLLSFCTM